MWPIRDARGVTGGLAIGLVLFPLLAAFVPGGSYLAALAMGTTDRWQAGAALIQDANPAGSAALVTASRLVIANTERCRPALTVLAGLLLVNLSRGGTFEGGATVSPAGLLCLILPVIMWTWYAVENAAFLKRRSDVQATEWASVVGAAALGVAVLWFAATVVLGSGGSSLTRLLASGHGPSFVFWSLVLGLGSSWGAGALFNKASARLPVSLTGQLIVFETVFGVAYVFIADGRSPKPIEIFGFALAVAGIWLSIRVLQRLGPPTIA